MFLLGAIGLIILYFVQLNFGCGCGAEYSVLYPFGKSQTLADMCSPTICQNQFLEPLFWISLDVYILMFGIYLIHPVLKKTKKFKLSYLSTVMAVFALVSTALAIVLFLFAREICIPPDCPPDGACPLSFTCVRDLRPAYTFGVLAVLYWGYLGINMILKRKVV